MTSEMRTLLELADISGVEIECRECEAKIFYPRENNHERIASQCPNCNANLFTIVRPGSNMDGSVAMEQVKQLMRIVKFLVTPGADCQANIRLHVKTPKL